VPGDWPDEKRGGDKYVAGADPALELHNGNGALLISNDNLGLVEVYNLK
jgi:hypothetical protein